MLYIDGVSKDFGLNGAAGDVMGDRVQCVSIMSYVDGLSPMTRCRKHILHFGCMLTEKGELRTQLSLKLRTSINSLFFFAYFQSLLTFINGLLVPRKEQLKFRHTD